MAVTVAQFKTAKPQFADVPDATVQAYLDMAAQIAFDPENDLAVISLVCHLMTIEGLGTDAQSQSWSDGSAGFQTIRSGQLTLTRFQRAAGGASYIDWLGQTACGEFYALLLRSNRSGPRVARGGSGVGRSYYAKDWPFWSIGYPPR